MTALLAAFGLVFVAELGDKSMLLVMVLAPRYGAGRVLLALVLEAAAVMALAVLLGGAVDALFSQRQLAVASGLVFIGFGLWALRAGEATEIEPGGVRSGWLVIGALALMLFLSELGDKTQVATLSLSSLNPGARLGVWAGATAGMVTADALAVVAGRSLLRVVSPRLLARIAGVLFVLVGVATFAFGLW